MRERFYNAISSRYRSARDFARSAVGTSQFMRAINGLGVAVRMGNVAGTAYFGSRLAWLTKEVVVKYLNENTAWKSYVNQIFNYAKSSMKNGAVNVLTGAKGGTISAATGTIKYAKSITKRALASKLVDQAWSFVRDVKNGVK